MSQNPPRRVTEVQRPTEERPRQVDGWRAGKPVEDPYKMKSWGVIQAKPSEFLIQMRSGRVRLSGQGASCFKLPWDSVAIVPTTVQRLHFTADQVTSEKAGVQVSGLAVYRIADPLIAYRMLNFSFPERAQQKLDELLVEMFEGAVRRLVANLTVEQCLSKRKEGLSQELMREIAPVVSGVGRVDDKTVKGWGVVVDTIEIQDVRVLSQQVFSNLQARYRQEGERQARAAELAKEKAVQQDEAEVERLIQLTRLSAETEVRERKQATEEAARLSTLASEAKLSEATHQNRLATERRKLELDAQLAAERDEAQRRQELRKLEVAAQLAAARQKQEMEEALRRLEVEAHVAREKDAAVREAESRKLELEAQVASARHAQALEAERQRAEVLAAHTVAMQHQAQVAEVQLQVTELETKRARLLQDVAGEKARLAKELENSISPEAIQLALAQQLPVIATAFQQQMGTVNITSVDGANPFGYIAAAVEGVMGLARSAGLTVPPKQ